MNTLPCHGLWGVCECVCVCVCVRTLSLERVIVPVAHVRGFSFCSISQKSGYACQQAAMIRSWREAFSSATGDNDKGNDDNAGAGTGTGTDAGFMFGVTSLAGGCSEAFPIWSPYQHFTEQVCGKVKLAASASASAFPASQPASI